MLSQPRLSEESENYLYNSCKTPVKFMEFGSYELAGIFSDKVLYSDWVVNQKNGLLVQNTSADWNAALQLALTQNDAVRNFAKQAHHDVHRQFNIYDSTESWARVLVA